MSTALTAPVARQEPTEVAPGTYLVHEVQHALGAPLSVFINSMVIDGDDWSAPASRGIADLPASTIASAHSPSIPMGSIAAALAATWELPGTECPAPPDQAALELLVAATRGAPDPAGAS